MTPSFYWYWEKGLSENLCDLAVSEMNDMDKKEAKIGNDDGGIDKNIRISKCVFPDENYWLEGILLNYALYANINAGWNYSVDMSEKIQLTEYTETGHYDWHEDWNPYVYPGFPVRKLSIVCMLSDPSDFEGGQLEFKPCYGGVIPLKKGSVVVFPSHVSHRVTPVTSGIRRTAVSWIKGKMTL